MATRQEDTKTVEGGAMQLAEPSVFERQAAVVPGPVGELLRAVAKAAADGEQHGMSDRERWRWSAVVVRAKKAARELSGGQR